MPGAPVIPPEWLAEILIAWLYEHCSWIVSTLLLVAGNAFAIFVLIPLRSSSDTDRFPCLNREVYFRLAEWLCLL